MKLRSRLFAITLVASFAPLAGCLSVVSPSPKTSAFSRAPSQTGSANSVASEPAILRNDLNNGDGLGGEASPEGSGVSFEKNISCPGGSTVDKSGDWPHVGKTKTPSEADATGFKCSNSQAIAQILNEIANNSAQTVELCGNGAGIRLTSIGCKESTIVDPNTEAETGRQLDIAFRFECLRCLNDAKPTPPETQPTPVERPRPPVVSLPPVSLPVHRACTNDIWFSTKAELASNYMGGAGVTLAAQKIADSQDKQVAGATRQLIVEEPFYSGSPNRSIAQDIYEYGNFSIPGTKIQELLSSSGAGIYYLALCSNEAKYGRKGNCLPGSGVEGFLSRGSFQRPFKLGADGKVTFVRLTSISNGVYQYSVESATSPSKFVVGFEAFPSIPSTKCDSIYTDSRSPLMIDLGGKGFALSSPENGTKFDVGANGLSEQLSWPKSDSNGFLVLPEDGAVHSAQQLFGDGTVGPDGKRAANGFDALAKYDSNRDGQIDSKDAVFNKLAVWIDRNRDGKSDRAELLSLNAAGIREIRLGYVESSERDAYGNEFRQISQVIMNDGSSREIVDVWFAIGAAPGPGRSTHLPGFDMHLAVMVGLLMFLAMGLALEVRDAG